MRSLVLAVPAFGWLLLAACDPHLDIEVQLTLPVAYMQSLAYPAQFAFQTDEHLGASATLCAALDQEYYITLDDSAIACAAPLEVRVAEGPWNPPSTGCVASNGNSYSVLMQNGGTEIATGTAYADYTSGGCKSASDTVKITLGQ
jgi:hypothetical protein